MKETSAWRWLLNKNDDDDDDDNNNNSVLYYLCAESTAKGPITDT
jgi:hypothetical protein